MIEAPFHPHPHDPQYAPHTPFDAELFRRAMAAVGYTAENLIRVGALPRREQRIPIWELRQRALGGGALEALVRLFVLADAEPAALIDDALAPFGIAPLKAVGLLVDAGDGRVRSQAALIPVAGWLMLRDFTAEVTGHADRTDKVLPVGAASLMAAQLTVRRPCGLAVDLGAGQGFQAIACAHHATRVLATDITPRSLSFAAMNACLAGAPAPVETRLGSFFEPLADVAGQVDCLVCNPPFVVAPPQHIVGYSTKLETDGAVEHIVRGAPAMLAEGGFATIIANWTHAGPDDWSERPKLWVRGAACDAWVLRFSVLPARAYALKWLEETGTPRDQITSALLNDWTSYYDSRGIGAISTGAFILRKRSASGRNWIRAEEREFDRDFASCSAQIERVFAGVTMLATTPDLRDVLNTPLKLTGDAALFSTRVLQGDHWNEHAASLRQHPGFPMTRDVSAVAQLFLAALGSDRTPEAAIRSVATRLAIAPETLREELAPLVVELLGDGYLVPTT